MSYFLAHPGAKYCVYSLTLFLTSVACVLLASFTRDANHLQQALVGKKYRETSIGVEVSRSEVMWLFRSWNHGLNTNNFPPGIRKSCILHSRPMKSIDGMVYRPCMDVSPSRESRSQCPTLFPRCIIDYLTDLLLMYM